MARRIGSRYVALEVLGRGTSGTVWRGEGPDGPVAIKLLREDLAADQEVVARFVQERTALAGLDHPNIVRVRDLILDGDTLALVMDLVDGSDLRDRLNREKVLVPETAVEIVADVADGLAAAHAAGIVHRDVKPENILLDQSHCLARLTDFGIARLADAPHRTRATRIIGTPDYLAPEVIEGCQPTPAVDVYALATVLYELLTGYTPFGGGHPGAVLRRHVTDAVPGIPGLPKGLGEVLAACLAKTPAARLTARELAQRLHALAPELAGMPPLGDAAGDRMVGVARPRPDDLTVPQRRAAMAGVVPLVPAPEHAQEDSSRDTHLSLKRSALPNLRYEPAPEPPVEPRRRRWLATTVTVAAVTASLGAFAYARLDGRSLPWGRNQASIVPSEKPTRATPSARPPSPAAPWSDWRSAPRTTVRLVGDPDAVLVDGDRVYVFARGADGHVWYIRYEGGRFGAWQRLDGLRVVFDPAATSPQPGRVDVFAVAAKDHRIYQRTLTGGRWTGWQPVDMDLAAGGGLDAASSAPGRVDVAVRTREGELAVVSGGASTPWRSTATTGSGRIVGSPALTSRAPGSLDAFVVRAGDRQLMRVPYTSGTWRPAVEVGLAPTADPDAAATSGRLRVFARAGNALVERVALPGGRWRQQRVAGDASGVSGPGVVALAGDRLAVFVRTAEGGLRVTTGAGL
ncbi:Serine/threonine protein kinase [Carbonactinospora thermoautotrophica]|uniref:non-specific serine/threonine protein kinase n=1 Tax=Carbonactinospora thermoautotrophica TaxID=1469144 RepID=A0A132MX17_9ACTN|nr:Serine/threonine protein kinase [Carbonactinospora thermoautotrophica]